MITLITGAPGSGKTAYVVGELLKVTGRPIYVHGIPDLTLAHEPAGPLEEWHQWAPDGALIVADEVQSVWRPRPAGSKVSEAVAALETHRHRGIDFFLITQHPTLVDQNVRRLVSRHAHIVSRWRGRFMYEWPECQTDVARHGSATVTAYTLPKQAFGAYKSAEIHTKVKRRIPPSVYALGAAAVVAVVLGFTAWNRVQAHMGEGGPADVAEDHELLPAGATVPALAGAGDPAGGDVLDFRPRLAGRPETAPAYDELRQVKAFPRIAGCALSERKGCECYTQQATRYPVPDQVCREIVEGNVFDPYADPQPVAPPAPEPVRAPDALAV
jgi:zona occludens toxin